MYPHRSAHPYKVSSRTDTDTVNASFASKNSSSETNLQFTRSAVDQVRSTMNCQVCQNSLYDDPVATASEECRVRITNAMLIQKSYASKVEEKSETTRHDMEDGFDGRYNRQRTRRREYRSSTGRVHCTKVRGRFTNESK